MAEKRKYFWLKLKKDFFKRHDIRVIEGMDNGKDYVLFYLKLLVESIDHDGSLRFNDMIPYDDKMLSSVTNTNIDIVRSAIQIFKALGLIEILDDKTIYMKQIESFIGSETNWAKEKRLQRTEKADIVHQLSTSSPPQVHQEYRDKSIENRDKSIEIEKEIDKEKESIKKKKIPPTIEDITSYCDERKNGIDPQHFFDYNEARGWVIGKNKMKDWKAAIRTWEKNQKSKQTDDWRNF